VCEVVIMHRATKSEIVCDDVGCSDAAVAIMAAGIVGCHI
jgi:hypothetical protein